MDEATGDMVHGSMCGVMTTGASLVAAQVGNGLYTDGQTGHINWSWLVSEGLRYTRFSMSGGTSWKKKLYETLKMADKTSTGRRNCVFS